MSNYVKLIQRLANKTVHIRHMKLKNQNNYDKRGEICIEYTCFISFQKVNETSIKTNFYIQ